MHETDSKMVTLVLGGARSGKSRWAQEFAERFERVAYVATAEALDAEMREKIRRHQDDRPKRWQTLEEPLELASVVRDRSAEFDLMLVDCLTVFVANLMGAAEGNPSGVETRIDGFLNALQATSCSIVVVSNEVGSGVVPEYASGRRYRDALGELNQRVGAIADNVVLMVAGFPLALKGSIGAQR